MSAVAKDNEPLPDFDIDDFANRGISGGAVAGPGVREPPRAPPSPSART